MIEFVKKRNQSQFIIGPKTTAKWDEINCILSDSG